MLRAVLFDLDGTLVDTLVDIAEAMNHALSTHGLPVHATDDYRPLVGEGVSRLVERALPPGRMDLHGSVTDALRAWYVDHMLDHSRPYEGVPALLDALAERGVPMAVLSNKPDLATRWMVERLLGGWDFVAVAGEGAEPRKPDPRGALRIARDAGIDPGEWLYLGDTSTDMETAVAAGMWPVGALWGFRDREELLEHGARDLVERPAQVLEVLDGGGLSG